MNKDQSLFIKVVGARGLASRDRNGFSNPYCVIGVSSPCGTKFQDPKQCIRSETVKHTLNPIWTKAVLPIESEVICYRVEIWDKDRFKHDKFLGFAPIELGKAEHNDMRIPLKARSPKDGSIYGYLLVEIVKEIPEDIDELSPTYLTSKIGLPLSPYIQRLINGTTDAKLKPVSIKYPPTVRTPTMHSYATSLTRTGEIVLTNDFKYGLQGFNITNPKMYQRKGLLLLRGDDSEVGICYDANSTRHFFVVNQSDMMEIHTTRPKHNWEDPGEYVNAHISRDFVYWYRPIIHLASTEVTVDIRSNFAARGPGPFIVIFFVSTTAMAHSKDTFFKGIFPWITFDYTLENDKYKPTVTTEDQEKKKVPLPSSKPNMEIIRAIKENRNEKKYE